MEDVYENLCEQGRPATLGMIGKSSVSRWQVFINELWIVIMSCPWTFSNTTPLDQRFVWLYWWIRFCNLKKISKFKREYNCHRALRSHSNNCLWICGLIIPIGITSLYPPPIQPSSYRQKWQTLIFHIIHYLLLCVHFRVHCWRSAWSCRPFIMPCNRRRNVQHMP